MKKLRIASNLSLPPEAVTQTFGILAKRGVGKTYTASVLTEEMLKARLHVAVVDPIGVWWGLRSSAGGKREGLPIVILGGDHADVPLEKDKGRVVADFIIDEGVSVVLDLSLFRKGEQTTFVTDFAEQLYHRNRNALHVMMDEADAFAPQRPIRGQERCLGAVEDLVRRGRARGIGVTLVTQRAAVLNKDVLTQVEVLVALRTIAPQDRDAIDAWVKVHGTPEQRDELMRSLPSLPIGTAWFWSPGWLDLFRRVEVRQRETYDSSATPAAGQRAAVPEQRAAVDLDALRERMAAVIERAKADDPRELRKRIRELEQEIAKRPTAVETKVEMVEKVVEVPVLGSQEIQELRHAAGTIAGTADSIQKMAEGLFERLDRIANYKQPARPVVPARTTPSRVVPAPVRPAAEPPPDGEVPALGKAERSILTALGQYPQGRSKTQVALLTGYASSGGGFNNAVGRLRSLGYIEGSKERLVVTGAGLAVAGDVEPLPVGSALLDHWLGRLPKAERLILDYLVSVYPSAPSKEEVAEATGYASTGGGFNNALSRLRTLELIERPELRASSELISAVTA